jgi:hypothetical protein
MKYQTLGKTGLKVSILGFGGIPIMRVGEKEATDVVNRSLDLGINFFHTSITYGDSARKIGQVMKGRRHECYLAVKIGGRTKEEAEKRLDESLKALSTDHIEVAELPVNAVDFPKVMGSGGAYEAFDKAKGEGVIDHIGITSHNVDFLTEAIITEDFSNLVTPFNYVANKATEKLLSLASELNMGVIAMKTLGKGGLSNVHEALTYVWNHDVDTAIVGMNTLSEVEQNVAVANNIKRLTEELEMKLRLMADKIVKSNRLSSSGAVY